MPGVQPLPIDSQVPAAIADLERAGALVLTAPPGAGKSTRLPPAIVKQRSGQVYLLQPRRVAARSLAKRMADEQGWTIGKEIGWRVRFERVGSAATRLWVMTEGSLTRQLQSDPYLDGVSAVILDEFHERSLHTDLCLAWLAELKRTVRPDLAVVVMSATMEAEPVARFLSDCPIRIIETPTFTVEMRYWQGDDSLRLEAKVADAVKKALNAPDSGDILVFLPGVGEIRAAAYALGDVQDAVILPLHGSLSPDEQDAALAPASRRKIVLSTNVAETSVTIPGVRTVIDSGLARVARFNADTGLDELMLENISKYSATQRAGRAGRTAPGRCIRLWSRLQENRMATATDPEIERVDLAPTLLTLKPWHGADTRTFPWFEAPSPERLQAGEDLLALLGASRGPYQALTLRGESMAKLPLHPRLAGMLQEAERDEAVELGASLAALVSERDLRFPRRRSDPPVDPGPADADDRLLCLERAVQTNFRASLRDEGIDPIAAREVVRVRNELLALVGQKPEAGSQQPADQSLIARLLLAAYPDRVTKRAAPTANRGAMVGGVSVEIDSGSCLYARPGHPRGDLFLSVVVQGLGNRVSTSSMVRQACELSEADIEAVFPGAIERREMLAYDQQRQVVTQVIGWFYRDLAIRMARDSQADPAKVSACLANALKNDAEAIIAADEATQSWLQRLAWLRRTMPDLSLPEVTAADFSELLDTLCAGCRSRAEVIGKPKLPWLQAKLSFEQNRALDSFAPTHLTVPSGSAIRLDYSDLERPPVLAVRLQELFGLAETPRLANGRVPVLLHLLGPNYRAEQITQDLASFWKNTYPQVRKDLRARYPKHSWPDDPLTAPPQAKGKHRPPR